MAKLTDYTEVTRFDENDILIKDGIGGTKIITVANAARELAGLVSAANHRNVYGGRNLDSTVTTAQRAAIQNGTFDDLYIGDYWTIGSVKWVIADMDYFYNSGDTTFTKHHLVIVPTSDLYNHVMNDTSTTEGGYVGSKMYAEGLDEAKTKISAAFGDLVLTHRDCLTNAVTNGYPSAIAWYDSTVELMNEVMVHGCYHCAPMNTGSTKVDKYTTAQHQLALFQVNPRLVNNRTNFWLRDTVSSTEFAYAAAGGGTQRSAAVNSRGVRPYFCIGV